MRRFAVHFSFAGLVLALLALSGCPPNAKVMLPRWNQVYGDASNSGQTVMATLPGRGDAFFTGQIGQLDFTSPVIAPDGTVIFSISGSNPATSGIFRISTNGSVKVVNSVPVTSLQLSTPAVADNGWIYVNQVSAITAPGSNLLMISPKRPQIGFQVSIPGRALSPPKLFTVLGMQQWIFVTALGSDGNRLQIWNNPNSADAFPPDDPTAREPELLFNQSVCHVVEGGIQFGFQITGVQLAGPEDPAVAIREITGPRNKDPFDPDIYVVVASQRCGISFYKMHIKFKADPSSTRRDPSLILSAPNLTLIKMVDTGDDFLSTPVIAGDGTVVINDTSKQRTIAYDVTTGDEKWHHDVNEFVSSTPALAPLNSPFVYIQSKGTLTKLDLSSGTVIGTPVPLDVSEASPVIGGQHIFVSTRYGLTTFDLDLKDLNAFTPLDGGRSSPAINTETGQVIVATTDGKISVFKGP